jgi:uncharacterized protein (DUF39 family)
LYSDSFSLNHAVGAAEKHQLISGRFLLTSSWAIHYADVHHCRQPEYVRNDDIFPKVWNKLYNGLAHPERITVGIRKVLEQLENSDEQADLATIEKRLAKIEQKMLSYADQRSEKLITPEQQRELTTRLQD